MKKNIVFNTMVGRKNSSVDDLKPEAMANYNKKSFTRKRKLTLQRLMYMLLLNSTEPLQIRIDEYFEAIGCKEETVSKQAFSKARTELDPNLVKAFFEQTSQLMCSCDDLELYKGKYRLCAIDGSDIALDNAEALRNEFGCSGLNKDAVTAMNSMCYDPLNDIILDAGLYPYAMGEREAAALNIVAVEKLPIPKRAKNLYLFDRGYPSKEFMASFIDNGLYFLMRVRKKFSLDFDLVEKKEKITYEHKGKAYCVRVFKILLESGETETLVTNLPGKDLKRKEAGKLYFMRWHIETKFDSLKNKLQLENMSGRRPVTVYQDFWARLDMANTLAALRYATDEAIEERTANSNNKYEQTTNENRLISNLSRRYVNLLGEPDREKRMALFDMLVKDISARPIEVKPDRKFERVAPRKMKFCDRRKDVLH